MQVWPVEGQLVWDVKVMWVWLKFEHPSWNRVNLVDPLKKKKKKKDCHGYQPSSQLL